MADPQSILQLGIEAARAGDKAHARELFRLVTREDPRNAQGWLWLAGVADDRAEKQSALEHVLEIDPNNQLARKGLDALGGGAAAVTTAASTPPAASDEPATTAATTPSTPADDQTPPALADDEPPAPRSEPRAAVYDDAAPAAAAAATTSRFNDDDYDLSDYQNRSVNDTDRDDDREPVVVVEDEEPRRRGFGGFIPMIIILLLVLLGLWYLWQTLRGGDTAATGGDGNGAAASITPEPGASDATGATGGITDTAVLPSDAAGGVVGSSPAPSDGTGTTDGASPAPVDGTGGSPAPVDQASAPAEGTGTESSPAAPEASVAPETSPAAPEASAPVAEASPAPPAPQPDVASANPAIVGNDQVITAGAWQFGNSVGGQSYSNVTPNAYGGVAPSRGRYLIALITVANTSGSPAQIPDGFFVVKDAQGRTYDFNRAASVDYFNRLPGAGDYAADTQIPPGAPLGSVPLLFDVNTDATDLVLFSRENTGQGFLIRQNAQ